MELPPGVRVVLTIQTHGRKKRCAGWFSKSRWSDREGTLYHEITITAEKLDRDPIEIIATIVHEVVHLWCNALGVQDTSTSGRHNNKFKSHASQVGLDCEPPTDSYGYGYTTATKWLENKIRDEFVPDHLAFSLFRLLPVAKETTAPKPRIFTCECEDAPKVRVAMTKTDPEWNCSVCNQDLVLQDEEE